VQELLDHLGRRFKLRVEERVVTEESVIFRLPGLL